MLCHAETSFGAHTRAGAAIAWLSYAQRSQAVFGVEITRPTAPDALLRRSAHRPIVRAYDGGPEAGALADCGRDSSPCSTAAHCHRQLRR